MSRIVNQFTSARHEGCYAGGTHISSPTARNFFQAWLALPPAGSTGHRAKLLGNEPAAALSSLPEEISKMIILKITAVVVGAGVLFELFSGDFGPDLALAVIACFS
jgi:hypothetical protein